FQTFAMRIVKGRNFSADIDRDKRVVVINETAMKTFGWTDVENKEIIEGGDGDRLTVVGVVEDYYYQSLKRSMQPLVHSYTPASVGRLAVRLKPGRIEAGLALLRAKWNASVSYEPF